MEPMFNIEKEKIPNNRTIIWRQERNVYEYSLRSELFLPSAKRLPLDIRTDRWKRGISNKQKQRDVQFLSWHTLWWETRERENEKEGKNVRGTEKSRKIQRAIIRTSTRKIKRRSRTLEINTFSRHPLFSRVLEKITSIEETLKKEKKKEREKSVQWKKIFFTFEPRSFSLARELNLCRNARNFLSQFLWTIVFDVNAKGKMLQFY